MLYLHQSNRLEQLLFLLCKTLASTPTDPLTAEIVVVQNPGMARWLFQQIALTNGIAANIDFPLPASFIWRLLNLTIGDLPDISRFSKEVLLWRIQKGLTELRDDPLFAEIRHYLADDRKKDKRIQLAATVADLFDQYLVHRPDMLLSWEQKTDEPKHWQARLWQWLASDDEPHRARLTQRFFAAFQDKTLKTTELPQRISLFGLNSLAPVYIDMLAAIGEYTDVHLFHLSPCRQAWDDILPEQALARQQKIWLEHGQDDVSAYFTSGNPLLASLGKVGRDFFQLLLRHDPHEEDLYERPDQNSLLGAVQGDILDLIDRTKHPTPLDRADASIRFHCCHSPMREVQVLHNRLLALFANDPDLKPGDILVMAPDINKYAPAIAGVFGAAGEQLRIPWSIADQSRRDVDQVIRGFLDLLALPGSRFTTVEVLSLLENPAIAARFDIRETDLVQLRGRITRAGIRWGLDPEQCRADGLPDLGQHTWTHGQERLLLGHCLGQVDEPWLGVLPSAAAAASAPDWLGCLSRFLRRLRAFARACGEELSPQKWHNLLLELVNDFFTDQDPFHDSLILIRETLADFLLHTQRAEFHDPLSLAEMRYHLEGCFSGGGRHAFLTGRVTFCNMVPMRSLPFAVIYLLGMNDAAYPRCPRPADFDLMAKEPRLGDRNRREDDRYLFLEALLSARRHFIVSWVGRDQRENTELPPATVVADLSDYLDRGWRLPGDTQLAAALTTIHPLQPFSTACFSGNDETAAYSDLWLPPGHRNTTAPFFNKQLTDESKEIVGIDELARFWGDPISFLLEQRLGLRLRLHDLSLPESEPFTLDNLNAYLLKNELLHRLEQHENPVPVCARAAADGLLPGFAGQTLHCSTLLDQAASLFERFHREACDPMPAIPLDLRLAGIRLTGQLDNLHASGRVTIRPGKYRGQDLLDLWVHHLALCLLRPAGVMPVSALIATNATLVLAEAAEPDRELERLLSLFREGQCRPLHFYPDVDMEMVTAKGTIKNMDAARKKWFSGYSKGVEDTPGYRLALRGAEPLDDEFLELVQLMVPIRQALEVKNVPA